MRERNREQIARHERTVSVRGMEVEEGACLSREQIARHERIAAAAAVSGSLAVWATGVSVCMCVYVSVCKRMCLYVCMYVCMYVHVSVCLSV